MALSSSEVVPSEHFYPSKDTKCSEPFSIFLSDYHAHLDAFYFLIKIVSYADEVRTQAAKALAATSRSTEERIKYEKEAQEKDMVLSELQKHATVHSQNLTNGLVSAFQRYFCGVIESIALRRPEILASSKTLRIDEILRFSRHRDLVAHLVQKRVNDLAYGGLKELETYFSDRLGIDMFDHDEKRNLLQIFIEARNINVHNGGFVNEQFLRRVGKQSEFEFKKGDKLHLDFNDLVRLSENAMGVALHIDESAVGKFRLRRKSHASWSK